MLDRVYPSYHPPSRPARDAHHQSRGPPQARTTLATLANMNTQAVAETKPVPGLRDRNKLEKRQRFRAAAASLF